MCGIAGYYCFGKKRPTAEEIRSLHIGNEVRGGSASGMGYYDVETQDFVLTKAPVGATDFHDLKSVRRWLHDPLPDHMILHTRLPTQGSVLDNHNNHPVIHGNWMAVHNGAVSNDDALYTHFKVGHERKGEVDSEAIPMALHCAQSIGQALGWIDGSWAIAALLRPEGRATMPSLLLARNSSPLSILIDVRRDILYWSSVDSPLKATFIKEVGRFMWHGMSLEKKETGWFLIDLARDRYLTFSEKGVLLAEDVKADRVNMPSSYSGYYGTRHQHYGHPHGTQQIPQSTTSRVLPARSLSVVHSSLHNQVSVLVPSDRRVRDANGKIQTIQCPRCSALISRRWFHCLNARCPACHVTLLIGKEE